MARIIFGREWTSDEETTLRKLWNTHDNYALAQRLDRSRNAVGNHGRRLGLRRATPACCWTQEEDRALQQLWPRPEVRIREIARQLGRTRNAIIGRAHRLHLVPRGRPKSYEPGQPMKPRQPRKPKVFVFRQVGPKLPPRPVVVEVPQPGVGIPLSAIQNNQCRAIISAVNGSSTMFCGQPVLEGSNLEFCPYHRQRYTMPPRR